ncbi:sulfoxide reductase heme-binding subunit YedZ [Paenalcaligenes niemegkensis]|uniref:sulfite oxidase heme-binding subunit YedZ n=1 Tax=Paenalcaligenes niemegkensis TaxID=2895469 RepID=UPI001EE9576A|nr:protein-methionine-sulfoxide reductase heme-binding subunit MsrQ [Paenalcaligenes niemegkensis]MCQ9616896.1 sulfoxide reductase heme-binding subunit YedZ [Paenalcaligenes niemegkensis]
MAFIFRSVSADRFLLLARIAVFSIGFFPLLRWLILGFTQGLSANPAEFLIRSSGIWATVLLWLTLAVSPVRHIAAVPSIIRVRRPLGLFAFFYTVLHVLGWALWERGLSLNAMFSDIFDRPFIAIGAIATVLMLLLACTSTHAAMRRLGANWKRLHRSVYLIGVLSIAHFYLVRSGKNDFNDVYLYGAVLLILLGSRLWYRRR